MTDNDLNNESAVLDAEAQRALLHTIIGELSPSMKKRITRKLEKERAHFARSSTPGHLVWYSQKVAVCAIAQRLF